MALGSMVKVGGGPVCGFAVGTEGGVVQIRRAKPAGEAAIRSCAEAAYARYVPRIGRRPAPMDTDFTAQITQGAAHVAVVGGRVAGFIVFFPNGAAMMLDSVAVHPDAAGQGVGRRLIGHCESVARGAGSETVQLYTNAKMTENLRLYPRLGYHEVDRRTEDGFDRVYFEKRLGSGPGAPRFGAAR